MKAKRITIGTASRLGFVCCLPLLAALLGGCSASRSYPGPIYGLTFDGTLQAIDLPNHQLKVAPLKPSAPVVFVWESTTKFWKNEIPIKADDVELGRNVRIHYHEENGRLIAHHIYVWTLYHRE